MDHHEAKRSVELGVSFGEGSVIMHGRTDAEATDQSKARASGLIQV